MNEWPTATVRQWAAPPIATPARFWPVRLDKFLVLTVLTFSLYPILWFWRNWKSVDSTGPRPVNAFARTLFSGIFYFSLTDRVGVPGGVVLACGYLASNILFRLPGGWSFIGFAGFLFLVPTVVHINRMNRNSPRPSSSDWRKRDAILPAVTGPLTALMIVGLLLPTYVVLSGSQMDDASLVTLQDAGILGDGEEILYFYSDDLFDIESSGALLSDWGVTSYWLDPVTESRVVQFIAYPNIADIEVNYADNWFEDTWVRVIDFEGTWIDFILSNEEDGDKKFVGELRSRIGDAESMLPAGDV